MPTQLELENTPEAMEARRREFAETAARTQAGLSQFVELSSLGANPSVSQIQPITLNIPAAPQASNPRQLSPLLAGLVTQTTSLPSLPTLPSFEDLAPLPSLTDRISPTSSLPQIPTLPLQERREVPVLTSEPARRELTDITTSLTQLEQQSVADFTRAEEERKSFIETQRVASEQQRTEEERRAKELAEEATGEREELGQRRLRAFEAQAATAGATRTSAALIELGGVERETQREIQGIRRQMEAAVGQARQAAAGRNIELARQSFEMAQTLRTQLAGRQQQAFENRLNIERLQDQRQQEDFSRRQAVAQFDLATREFDEESVQREFGRAMQQAQFELNTRQAEQEEAQREFNRAQADSQLLLEVRRAQLQARQVLTEEQQQDFQNRLALTKFNSDEVQNVFNRVMAIEDFESRKGQQEFQNALSQANFELDTQRLRLQASQAGAEETQRSFTNQLALAQQRLAEQQEARRVIETGAELELRTRVEERATETLAQQKLNQARDDARAVINSIITNFGGADLASLPDEMKKQFATLEESAGLPVGFITQGLETQKEKALAQQKELAEARARDKAAQDAIMNEIKRTQIDIQEAKSKLTRGGTGGLTETQGERLRAAKSEGLKLAKQKLSKFMGSDGFVNTAEYTRLRQDFSIAFGGDIASFDKTFGHLLNPNDPTAKGLLDLQKKILQVGGLDTLITDILSRGEE